MVLQGLTIPIWVGWLSGILYFKFPWGLPRHNSWFEPIFLYHGILNVFSLLIWLDYMISFSESFGSDVPIRQIITKIFTYLAVIFSAYLRLCFAVQVKKSTQFFQCLEHHPIFASTPTNPNPLERRPVIGKANKWVIMIALILKTTAAAAFAAAVATQRKRGENSVFSSLTQYEYFILFFLFGSQAIANPIHIAFSFTLVNTKYVVYIFEEFCNCFERAIAFENGETSRNHIAEQLIMVDPPPQAFLFPTKGDLMNHNYKKQMRESLFKQFDCITGLFQMYDEVAGPYILGLFILTIVFFVQTINAILIFDLSPLFIAFDWLALICLVAQLVLILFNLGHYAHRTMAQRKMRLRRLIAGMSNTHEKAQLVELMELVASWDWKMSAWGFFIIDRSLMPGVLSIMMSYVVILFQLQLSTNSERSAFRPLEMNK